MRRVGVGLLVLMPGVAFAQGQPTPLIPPSINYQQGQQDQAQPGSQDQPPAPIEATPLPPPSGAAAAPEAVAPATPPAEAQGPGAPPPEAPAPSAPAAEAQGPAAGGNQAAAPPAAPEQQPMVSQWPNKWVPQTSAVIRVLNKVDAISRDVTVKVGQTADVGSLSIKVQACVARPPDQPADAAAFLVISDGHKDEAGFQGWSLADEPWVSMLQNPVYNVRVVGCS
ncbi:MAG: DUF2155 domain-containing protein [Acetobacteraceae bacterium]|nr:DUF2155 domain-containing protein [Acetobacteraceae bacterium]